ncbi:unnamed protein product [Lactuca saligna]|uniref:Uncharacterized protein n=1 Tax=Lactuca saligna TaxID=75948 RepID=A0AA36E2W9_LACSI|nr:unnamed protein product [Lactuca saligna]
MSNVLYVFSPNANVVKGTHAPNTPIVIQAKNVALTDIIPNQFKNSRIKYFDNYVKSCPLHYALCDFPEPFYPKQVANPYVVESYDSEEEDNEGNDEEYQSDDDINSLDNDMVEASDHGMMINSPPRLKNHIHFSSSSPSPPFAEASPPPQAITIPPIAIPICTTATFQEEYSSNFQSIVLSQLSLLVYMNQSLRKRLTKVENYVVSIKHIIALVDDD